MASGSSSNRRTSPPPPSSYEFVLSRNDLNTFIPVPSNHFASDGLRNIGDNYWEPTHRTATEKFERQFELADGQLTRIVQQPGPVQNVSAQDEPSNMAAGQEAQRQREEQERRRQGRASLRIPTNAQQTPTGVSVG